MYQSLNSETLIYSCLHCKVSLPQSLLLSHLSLSGIHKVSKLNHSPPPNQPFQKLIIGKITSLLTVQSKIQQSSLTLNQVILKNTQVILNKLDQVIRLYRKIFSEASQNLKNTEIISDFSANNQLNIALTNYFEQKIFSESCEAEKTTKVIKKKISEILENKCDIFFSSVVSNSENFIVTGGQSGIIRIWDLKINSQRYCLQKHKGSTEALAISLDDSLLLSGSNDCTVRLWDLKSKQHLHAFKGHINKVSSVLISGDKKTAFSVSYDCSVKIWNLETRQLEMNLPDLNKFYDLYLLFNETVIACAGSQGIIFWNRNIEDYSEVSSNCSCIIVFTKDERYFITGDFNGMIRIWLTKIHKIEFEDTQKHTSQIGNIAFNPCFEYFVTCSYDKKVIIWDFYKRIVVRTLDLKNGVVNVRFLKKFDSLVIFKDFKPIISYYNLVTNENKAKIKPKILFLQTISISSDFKYIAYGCKSLSLYEIKTNIKIKKITHGYNYGFTLKFSPDNNYLGVGYQSGEIFILKVPCLTQIKLFHYTKSDVYSLSFSINNKYLASGYFEKIFFVQEIDSDQINYSEKNVYVTSSAFCYEDKRLVYSEYCGNIHVLNKKFVKLRSLKVDFNIFRLLVSKNNRDVFFSDCQSFCSCVDSKTGELKYGNEKIKNLKKLNLKDSKLQIFMNLPRINMS